MRNLTRRGVGRAAAVAGAALALAVLAAGPTTAQEKALPGIGARDGRAAPSVGEAPWSSLVRVNTEAGTHCTGVVVATRRIATAAHCLVAPRTGRLVRAERVHVLLGYDRGTYTTHVRVKEIAIAPGFVPERRGPAGADWAILELARDVPATPLPIAGDAAPGTPAMLGGWQRDRAHALRADTACRIVALVRDPSGPLLRHDCNATAGASGGPLLVRQGDGWAIAGIAVLAHRDAPGGHAVAAASLALSR
jgi:protease YdgD